VLLRADCLLLLAALRANCLVLVLVLVLAAPDQSFSS